MPSRRLLFAAVVALLLPACSSAQPIKRADVKPGLVFAPFDGLISFPRLEPGVGLTLGRGEAAASEYDTATSSWNGTLNILQAGKYRFSATVQGTASVAVGGVSVLDAKSAEAKFVEGAEVTLAAGVQRFGAGLHRDGAAARLELFWEGPGFKREPVPYFFFGHTPAERPAWMAATQAREHGRFLVEEHGCVKCHAAGESFRLAERAGPNLTKIGERTTPGWLDAWLKDPHALRPNTVMPKMFADDAAGAAERYAVVAYLSGLGTPAKFPRVATTDMTKSVANGAKLYLTVGCATCHGDQVTAGMSAPKLKDEEDEKPAYVPADGLYNLGTSSPQVMYVLGHPGSKFTPEGLTKYLANPLATNPHGRMPSLNLTDAEARDLARYLTRITNDKLTPEMPKAPPAPEGVAKKLSPGEWAEVGQQVFAAKGCANCHAIDDSKAAPRKAAGLGKLTWMAEDSCLSATPNSAKVPAFKLDAKQKADIGVFLRRASGEPDKPSPAYEAKASFKRFGCLNCHNRDGEGGIPEDLAAKMKSLESAENADDVAPPRLTQVGHKLRTPYLAGVLLKGERARPWMSLRMPQYGEANVGHLVHGLAKLEGTLPDDAVGKVPFTAAKIEAGRALAGKAGLGCVACHDISGVSGGGTRGPDLARTHERVRLDWYTRWMHQPQRLAPGTKMPTNFLDGKSVAATVYGGDADQQIEAMWAYFSLGQGLPLPSGMEPPKGMVVSVGDRPELMRTFMPDGAGTRPVAIGFPGGVNAVFDTATCRVSYAWAGNFLDATPVWKDRGGNQAKLLGPKFWTGPAGFPWATTGSTSEPPDFARQFADPAFGHQLASDSYSAGPRNVHFLGYATDAAGTPSFAYELRGQSSANELAVTEAISPLPIVTAAGFRRTLTVTPGAGRVTWLYVGAAGDPPRVLTLAGGPVAVRGDVPASGTRLVLPEGNGGRTAVVELATAPADAVWVFAPRKGGGTAVLLKLPTAAKTVLPLDVWGLSRPDDELLKGLRK